MEILWFLFLELKISYLINGLFLFKKVHLGSATMKNV